MSYELKPCPFCGGEAKVHETYDMETNEVDGYFVWCDNKECECRPETREYFTEAEAISAWNTRAVETCENIGYYIDGTRFECSNCGYNGWTKWAKDGYDRVPNYCPNCGAKVVGA